jgi:phage/plasmid-like protein (TIGR03299 family)
MHLIDMSNKRANMAYVNEAPWHGLGTKIPSAGATLLEWEEAAGLKWTAKEAPVMFQTDPDSDQAHTFDDRKVLFRSDTLAPLSVVGAGYKPVQPNQVISFYDDLCTEHGYAMETMGSLKEGKVIWALAKTGVGARFRNIDEVNAYLLLYTSFDQSSATVAKFTSVRVVCNNTLTMAAADRSKSQVSIRHDSNFDASKVKFDLQVGSAWTEHQRQLEAMADVKVDREQQVEFLLDVYHNLTVHSVDAAKPNVEKTMQRMAQIISNAPGANLETAKNTVYGLLQAVTFDVDHSSRARSSDGRLASAWMGAGEALKNKALDRALTLAAIA